MSAYLKRWITTFSTATILSINISSFFFRIMQYTLGLTMIATHAYGESPSPTITSGSVEVSALHSRLSGGNSDWNDQYLRGSWKISPIGSINGEISNQNHFADQGIFIGTGYTHIFNDTWHGSLSAGTSAGGFFLPKTRIDGSISKKWLAKKTLVSNIGLGYYQAKDAHSDRNLLLSALYYFDMPLIMEAGIRFNESNPGSVHSNRSFAVLTYGKIKQHYFTLRYETGREAYQFIGENTTISDFSSNEISLIWRQWFSKDYGLTVLTNHYSNPYYDRSGVQIGVFHDF